MTIARMLFVFAGTVSLCAPAGAQNDLPPGLDKEVESIRTVFDVPGIGLGIVRDGRVVLARGYGLRKMGKPDRVDGNTLFGIASNTKAFTPKPAPMSLNSSFWKVYWPSALPPNHSISFTVLAARALSACARGVMP